VAGSHLGFTKKIFSSFAMTRIVDKLGANRLPRSAFSTVRNDTGNDKKRATSLLRNDKVRGQVCKQVLILTGLVFNGYLLANHLHFAILLQTDPCQNFHISYISAAIPE